MHQVHCPWLTVKNERDMRDWLAILRDKLLRAMDNGTNDERWPPGLDVADAIITQRDELRVLAQDLAKALRQAHAGLTILEDHHCDECDALARAEESGLIE